MRKIFFFVKKIPYYIFLIIIFIFLIFDLKKWNRELKEMHDAKSDDY